MNKRRLSLLSLVFLSLIVGIVYFKNKRDNEDQIILFKGKETIKSVTSKLEKNVHNRLKINFENIGLSDFPTNITLVAFKEEKLLEVYTKVGNIYKKIKTFPFTAYSGELGPKLKEGDKQIPEGLYKIEYLNPNSSYYLSMKVNYPNEFDRAKAKLSNRTNLGGDIFIHGKAVTIGCIPIGDQAIEELFVLVSRATTKTTVIISPRDFRKNKTKPNIDLIDWESELYDKIIRVLEDI